MEKYAPTRIGAPGSARYSHPVVNAKLREKAERSVARRQSQIAADRRKEDTEKHAAIARLTAVWKDDIIPRWPEFEHSTRLRKLVAEGVPTALRGTVWPLLIGNKAQVTMQLYEQSRREAFRVKQLSIDQEAAIEASGYREHTVRFADEQEPLPDSGATEEACDTDTNLVDMPKEPVVITDASSVGNVDINLTIGDDACNSSETDDIAADLPLLQPDSPDVVNREDTVDLEDLNVDASVDLLRLSVSERRLSSRVQTVSLIQWDIPRTFPTLSFFQTGAPLNESLENVLMAYAAYRPDVGYVQGMSFLVAMLLLQMDEYSAFQCLVNLMKSRNQLEFYRLNLEAVTSFSDVFNFYFYKYLPLLFRHFNEQGMSHTMFLVDWNLTIFSKALPLDCAIRIWDSYLVEGEVFVMRAAIGLLRLYAPRLSQMTMESIAPFLMRLPDDTSAVDVLSNIAEIKISHSNYNSICEKHKFISQEWTSGTLGPFHRLSEMLSPDQPQPKNRRQVLRNLVSAFLPTKSSLTSASTSTAASSTPSSPHPAAAAGGISNKASEGAIAATAAEGKNSGSSPGSTSVASPSSAQSSSTARSANER